MKKLIVELPDPLHESLRRKSALLDKTIKEIVTDLLRRFLAEPLAGKVRETGLCGLWKDEPGSADEISKKILSGRRWPTRKRPEW
ncbi:MAG: hypothetical protein HY402_03000 [Elusimicrobia bacterium]|nr:hypothetical protein [Elusimicrobiota bacterium]